MRTRLTTRLGAAGIGALVVLALAAPAYGLSRPAEPVPPSGLTGLEPTGADMPTVGGNLGNQHYSGLTQIDKSNLDRLAPAWRTHVSAVAPATDDVGQQTTPIVVDGVLYLDTPSGGVIAVDGASGEAVWKWEPTEFATAQTRRGVSAGDGKIFTHADGDRVVALDQATGEQVWVVQPTGPNGEFLGNLERVATVYHDGIVYAHAANGDRAAVVALNASDGSYVWHFFGGPDRDAVYTDVNGNTVAAGETWGPTLPDRGSTARWTPSSTCTT
jgi:glucose dehydrogenase